MKTQTLKIATMLPIVTLTDGLAPLTSLEESVTFTQQDVTQTVTVLTSNMWASFLAQHNSWKFLSLVQNDFEAASPQNTWVYFTMLFEEFWSRKEKGITDAVKAFYREYDFGTSYGEDKTVTNEYGSTITNEGNTKAVTDKFLGRQASVTGGGEGGIELTTIAGADVETTTSTAPYDSTTLKQVNKTEDRGSSSNLSGSDSWGKQTRGGEDTETTKLSGYKGDISERIRKEIEFRVQQDIAKQIFDAFAKECLFFDGSEEDDS